MLKRIVVFVIIIFSAIIHLQAEETSDTVWTKELWQLGDQIYQVQFTPDSQSVAVAIGGGVYVFDIKTGNIVKQFNKYMLYCRSFTLSEDGTKLITSSDENWGQGFKIIIWDYAKEDTIRKFNDISISSIKTIDNNRIIGIGNLPITNQDSNKIYIFDINSGKILKKIEPESVSEGFVYKPFEISKISNLIGVTNYNSYTQTYIVELWDLTTLEKITTLGTHDARVNDLSFSPDGKYLASASSDGYIKVWDLEKKALLKSIIFDSNLTNPNARYIKFSPNSGFLVGGGGIFGKLSTKIWKIPFLELVHNYSYGATYGLDISNDSTYIVIGSGSLLALLKSHWSSSAIEEPIIKFYKMIYPNPTGNNIIIPIELDKIPNEINISDIKGNSFIKILKILPIGEKITIDISTLPIGNYFVGVIYNDKIISYKFNKIR